jgi:hypothetical protein
MQTLKAQGSRGDWFAMIDGERIPCAWGWWLTGNHYLDPVVEPDKGKWPKYIAAIIEGKKVALTGKKETDGKWQRDGYIALFAVANVTVTGNTLEFDLIQPRLATLK